MVVGTCKRGGGEGCDKGVVLGCANICQGAVALPRERECLHNMPEGCLARETAPQRHELVLDP